MFEALLESKNQFENYQRKKVPEN